MTDVVAQPESELAHWAALRNKKLRSKLPRHDRLKPLRLAGWWTTGAAGRTGHTKKLHFGAKTATPFLSLRPLAVLPIGGEMGAPPRSMTVYVRKQRRELGTAASRQDSVRREEASQEFPGASPTAIDLPSQDGRHLCRE